MTDPRVHPTTGEVPPPLPLSSSGENPTPPAKIVPPPETYVVQFPKEQILRYPPPENARKYKLYTRRAKRGSCCRRCCCYTLCILVLLIVAAAISAGVLYLVFRFKAPKYTVTNLAIKGMNLTSAASISPGFDVTIRVENPNSKVGIYYLDGSSVNVLFEDLLLSDGVLPNFYQPKKNVTLIETVMTGHDVVLGSAVKTALTDGQSQGRIPLGLRIKAPVKIRVGSANTWKINVKVKCNVVVDALSEKAKIISNDCNYSVRLW